MIIAARRLPKTRDQMRRWLAAEPLQAPRLKGLGRPREVNRAANELGVTHLDAAELYWVSSDMAALATSAGRQLDVVSWSVEDRPSPSGLIVMDGGVGSLRMGGVDLPTDAIVWGPHPHGLMLSAWVARWRAEEALATLNAGIIDPAADPPVPPLVAMASMVLPALDEPQPVRGLAEGTRTVAATLAAAWHLMDQPTVAERSSVRAERGIQRAYGRAQRSQPEITIIELRRSYRPSGPDEQPVESPGRYSHRWVVSGHWRNQAYGPERAQRRRIWIPDYLKGPDGAPLLARERVNVWRR